MTTAEQQLKPIRADLPGDAMNHLIRIQETIGQAIGVGSLPRQAALAHIIRETDPHAAAESYVRRLQQAAHADHAAKA